MAKNVFPGKIQHIFGYSNSTALFKLYVDLDQVLVDWDGAVKKLTGEDLGWDDPEDKKNRIYKAIDDAGPNFWSEMKWLSDEKGGRKLWKIMKPFNPVLLSSPGKFRYAEQGKKEWVKSHTPGTTLFLTPDKYEFAERDAVLIDDNEDNIRAWRDAGGIGILHKDTDSTEVALLSLLSPREV